jgi:hypothetical protein
MQSKFLRVALQIQKTGAFGGNAATLVWPLKNTGFVTFNSVEEFDKIDSAISDYVMSLDSCKATGAGPLPVASVTIP